MLNFLKLALATTTGLAAIAATSVPAMATFPGSNGQIAVTATVYESCRDNDEECFEDSFVAFGDASGKGLLRQLSCDPPCGDRALAWSPDGRRLAFERDGRLGVVNADGTGGGSFSATSSIGSAGWSPDGQQLVFDQPRRDGRLELYVIRSDGTARRRLTDARGQDPTWSVRNQIAFVGERRPFHEQIYTVDPDGSGKRRLTRGGRNLQPDFSPDGQRIVFKRCATAHRCDVGRYDVYVVRSDGTGLRRLTRGGGESPSWSPDGRYVVFSRAAAGERSRLYTIRPSGRGLRRLRYRLPSERTRTLDMSLDFPVWQPVP